ncbi:tRNA-uridine aminocarboxypropyltransferase [Wukongibacter baidiensis]|uniref:tRNA-uridine aminocarboxypropyltransferase n=1 Tax=Wukongibacter baidiensis TaxID=1723361 RepID=UPI003D7FF910
MDQNYNVKQITSLYDSCNKCGLSVINCICDRASQIKTNAKIWILSTKREFHRPSNTARLINLVNPDSTEIFLWERTKEPKQLIENISDERYEPYLIFPAEDEESINRKVEYKPTGKIPAFIIIDGTWKEARRIFRKSDYLKKLPIISLEPDFKSQFTLRKGAGEGDLCTIEAVMEVLKINGETENVQAIDSFYNLFLRSFRASASGHRLKE